MQGKYHKEVIEIARKKLIDKLININDINEEMKLIKGSDTDYITPSGKIYSDYGNDMYYPKSIFENKHNHYLYTSIKYREGIKQRRHHILLAEAYIPNPNNYSIVGHLDNDKSHNTLDNLYWTTIQENTQKAVDDGLMVNDKGYDDSQSMPVVMFDAHFNIIAKYGSVSEASRETGVDKNTILWQAKNQTPLRKEFFFRFQDEKELKFPRVIIQYDFNTHEEINRFLTSGEASRITKVSDSLILDQCHKNKIPKWSKSGYYFLFNGRVS